MLTNTLHMVNMGGGLVRLYRRVNSSADGMTEYYRCSRCDSLNSSRALKFHPKLIVRNGAVEGRPTDPVHHADCLPMTVQKALAVETDRECRLEARKGHFPVREIHKKVTILMLYHHI